MNFDKLIKCVSEIEIKYFKAIDHCINNFLQEIIDADDYYDNGAKDISTSEILEEVAQEVNIDASNIMLSSALEFCITNYYPLYGEESWNCIDYMLNKYKRGFREQIKST